MKTSQKEQIKTKDVMREESKHEIKNMPQKSFVPWEKNHLFVLKETVDFPGSDAIPSLHGSRAFGRNVGRRRERWY